ncbi:MAG: hypothetical protein LBL71_02530 [Endomicrobium sp.]|jgi:hypothetical protein|nr:hypothetical protein [Endomicrobium sp.]
MMMLPRTAIILFLERVSGDTFVSVDEFLNEVKKEIICHINHTALGYGLFLVEDEDHNYVLGLRKELLDGSSTNEYIPLSGNGISYIFSIMRQALHAINSGNQEWEE